MSLYLSLCAEGPTEVIRLGPFLNINVMDGVEVQRGEDDWVLLNPQDYAGEHPIRYVFIEKEELC